MQRKECVVHTGGDQQLILSLAVLAKQLDYEPLPKPDKVYFFGKFDTYKTEGSVLHDSEWPSPYAERWQHFDLTMEGQLEKLKIHWGIEPEFDETPLPNFTSMKPEQEKETREKFNLSPEQWEMLPITAQEALSGAKVKIVKQENKHEWHPVGGRKPRNWITVVGSDPSTDNCAVGYWDGQEWNWMTTSGEKVTPSHWAFLPGDSEFSEPEVQQ